jgi:hypothetical protein
MGHTPPGSKIGCEEAALLEAESSRLSWGGIEATL